MQNYRNNSMNYNNYRPVPVAPCTVEAVKKDCLEDMPLAMAYVPWQTWRNIYDAEKALCQGTIFQELDLPFRGIGGCQK